MSRSDEVGATVGRVSRALGWAILASSLAACGAAPPPISDAARDDAARAIEATLDDWHEAAAASDEERYFDHLAEDAVFLGTDATERWTKAAFREYAHPHFEAGDGWAFRAVRRDVVVDPRGRLAWFDEELETEGLGPARGSGVLRRGDDGRWRIAQYNLALTIPNERFREVRALLAGASPPTIEGTAIPDTPESRAVIAAVERYRDAMLAGDAEAIVAMISARYHDDAGTETPNDDVDAAGMRGRVRELLRDAEVVSFQIAYRAIEREGDVVHVDASIEGVFRIGGDTHRHDDDVRLTLERDAAGLRFLSGL